MQTARTCAPAPPPSVRHGRRPIRRRYGKPLDYARLGKCFPDGLPLMRHMHDAAAARLAQARAAGAVRTRETCPICGHAARASLEFQGFTYATCQSDDCGHQFVATLLDAAIREAFFREDTTYSRVNYCDPSRVAYRVAQIATPKVEHVLRHIKRAGTWLDVGCGSGEILAALRAKPGWRGIGLELSQHDADFGRRQFGVDIRNETVETFAARSTAATFDVVSLFGVLHCVEEPVALARAAAGRLSEGGLLVAEVTNGASLTAAAVASFPYHPTRSSFNGLTTLHQFSKPSLQRLLREAGVEPVSVWHYGADWFEILNQWCLSDPQFSGSALERRLLEAADALQRVWDEREQSSHMLWISVRH